jgi:hypothetical protein
MPAKAGIQLPLTEAERKKLDSIEQMNSAPHCSAMSGGHGDLSISRE